MLLTCISHRPRAEMSLGAAGRVEAGREHRRRSAAPFPSPARQTGRAYLRHPAFRLASS